jgi:hypothetical protein
LALSQFIGALEVEVLPLLEEQLFALVEYGFQVGVRTHLFDLLHSSSDKGRDGVIIPTPNEVYSIVARHSVTTTEL